MCCFRVADVFLEDPPPEKKKKEEEKVTKNYVLASDQLDLQPIVGENFFSARSLSCPFIPASDTPHHQPRHLQDWSINCRCLRIILLRIILRG